MEALSTLRSESFAMFEANLLDLKTHSAGSITLKTAMDIAQRLTVGLFDRVYAQIDPMRLGEDGRLVKIALEYGSRLDRVADNLEPGALARMFHQSGDQGDLGSKNRIREDLGSNWACVA